MFAEGKSPVHLAAPAAIAESLRNIRHHEEANRAAIVEALRVMLDAFSPGNLMRRLRNTAAAMSCARKWTTPGHGRCTATITMNWPPADSRDLKCCSMKFMPVYDRVLREKQREPEA